MHTSSVCTAVLYIFILCFWYADCLSNNSSVENTTLPMPTNTTGSPSTNTTDQTSLANGTGSAAAQPTIFARTFDGNKDSIDVNACIQRNDLEGVALILAKRTDLQRQQIKVFYQQNYKTTLEQDLQGKTKKTFERLMNALLQPLPEFLASQIAWSLDQDKNWEYMSILCTSSGEMISQIVAVYFKAFGVQLRDDIGSKLKDQNGIHFLQAIIDASVGPFSKARASANVTESSIARQMSFIPNSNGNCYEVDNELFYGFMTTASFAQIKAVVTAYQNANKFVVVADLINKYCFFDLREAYSRIVRYSMDPIGYWATEIYESMAGKQTDDRALSLVILSRCEIDLATIRDRFGVVYHNSLENVIRDRCSEAFEDVMVKIVTGN